MTHSAYEIATDASFQALTNCYLREVDAGVWHAAQVWQHEAGVKLSRDETHVVELVLATAARAGSEASRGLGEMGQAERIVAIGVRFRSIVGRHTLTAVYEREPGPAVWRELDTFSAQLRLVECLYAHHPNSPQRMELIGRIVESHQVMIGYLEHWVSRTQRTGAAPTTTTFIDSEQSVVLGHWLHPTPKSRQGIHNWQHPHYAPELGARFQLHFFAASRTLVEQASLLTVSAEEMARMIGSAGASVERYQELSVQLGSNYCLLPVHPLQAQWLLHQPYVLELLGQRQLVDCGRLGPEFTPTSSVRTLYCESLDVMVKLSMPVKITNSLRINLASELGDSVWITALLRRCGLSRKFPELQPIEDPAYITLRIPNVTETGFEAIFRSNPFCKQRNEATPLVHSVAVLVQDPLPGQSRSQLSELIHKAANQQHISVEQASRRWFDAYWHSAIASTITIYDEFGISLEAHQQNVLLDFTASGYPHRSYYRDIQGLALSEGARQPLLRLVPELEHQTKVFEDDDIVRNGFGYYVFFNQLYSVINRFALDGLLDELTLLRTVRRNLIELRCSLKSFGASFIDAMLYERAIPCKANLLTRVSDMDELQSENELAVYTMLNNPLVAVTNGESRFD